MSSIVAISSESSLSDVKAAYYDNCTYDVDQNLQEAQTFVAACRQLLVRIPKQVGHGNRAEEVQIDPEVIERQMQACMRWIYTQNVLNRTPTQRILRRNDGFWPMYPGPYYD